MKPLIIFLIILFSTSLFSAQKRIKINLDKESIKKNHKILEFQLKEKIFKLLKSDFDNNTKHKSSTQAAIGSSIVIKGEITGKEDLLIDGKVEGSIHLKGHNVMIGQSGQIKANIDAKLIVIEGELHGDVNGEEKVIIRETGNVHGNIVSPRVTLEDGALFKGSIEMEPQTISMVEPKQSEAKSQDKEKSNRKSA